MVSFDGTESVEVLREKVAKGGEESVGSREGSTVSKVVIVELEVLLKVFDKPFYAEGLLTDKEK